MSDPIAAIPLATRLPADAYYHLIRTLRLTLPPPPDAGPEALAKRDHAAIARVAALAPADAAEAELAAQFVAASEQWTDCLRLAHASGTSPEWAAKCRAQGLAMMRQANAALSLLLRLQGARAKLDNAAADRRAWIEHTATRLMTEALAEPTPNSLSRPAGEGRGEGPGAAGGTASPAGEGRGEGPAGEAGETPSAEPSQAPAPPAPNWIRDGVDLLAAAERYAGLYPERAAQIRRTGKLPSDVRYFSPPEAAVAHALIAGTTPALEALNHMGLAAPVAHK